MAVVTVYASKDASALESNDGWSGWDDHHPVGISSSGNKYRSFVYFPINFSGMVDVTNATLWLRGHRGASGNHVLGATSGSRTIYARRMTLDWGEGTDRGETVWSSSETWGWDNRAGSYTTNDQASRAFTTYAEGTWYSWDITNIVNDWKSGVANYGLILMNSGETDSNDAVEFYARDAGSGYRPYVEVTYNTNIAPDAPVSMSPTGDALVNTLLPTLTGTRSDFDAGDYITAYQIRVYTDAEVLIWDSGTITQSGTSIVFSKVYSGPALSGGTFYKWRARTRDKASEWGVYSGFHRFKTNSPPNPPSINITQGTTDIQTLTPTLNITHSDNDPSDQNMYGYHIILETSTGTAVWDSGDIDTTSSPAVTKSIVYAGPALSWGTSYQWRAKTKDINGVWGNYTTNQGFSTYAMRMMVNGDPAGDEVISGLVPTFYGERGDSLTTISSYRVLLYQPDGTQIWDSGTLSTGIASGASFTKAYTGTALSYGTRYHWRAYLTGAIGGTSSLSANNYFYTPADASIPTQSITPVTNGRVTSLTPTFAGTRSTAFTNYQIEVYPSTSTSTSLGTPIWDSGNISQASSTSFSRIYSGTALSWNTTYKWRVRVGAPTLGTYTGLASFTTDVAAAPTITSPINNLWITTLTPTFTGTSTDSVTGVRIRVFDSTGNSQIWDSGVLSQTAATSFSKVYAGPALVTGTTYQWDVQLTKSTGPTSPYSSRGTFRINGAPMIPTSLEPTPGYTLSGILTPTFRAYFNDPERDSHGDVPTQWIIEIRNNVTDALIQTKTLTTGLVAGTNTYVWGTNTGGADTGLAYGTVYKWRTAFVDSKSATGAYSSYQTFSAGQPPTVTITSPSNGSNVATTRPTVTWTYSDPASSAMMKYRVVATRVSNGVKVYDSGERVSGTASFQIPTGYLQVNGASYTIDVTAWNSSGIESNTSSSTVELQLAAPPRIEGLSATVYEEESRISLEWDKSSLGSAFVTYVIYRKDIADSEWSMIGTRKPETNNEFSDYYAGQGRELQYRVTVVKLISNEPDVESPDSDIVTAALVSDVWMVVGRDRSPDHIFELPVSDESHTRPVQQESFEPLGTNRKVVVRGFVLGHEGTFEVVFTDVESRLARERIEYLLYYAGPHILKNPFGDVFDVTFGSPDYQYVGGGTLTVTLTYIEVGATSNPTISPDEYLLTIGAT